MPQRVASNVVDHRVYDGGVNVEDITSITLPNIEYAKADFENIAGLVGALSFANPAYVGLMTCEIAHNNGLNCDELETPVMHEIEFRLARQDLNVPDTALEYGSAKYRIAGQPVTVNNGTIERGNPLGSTVTYNLTRFIKEIAGKTVTHIDIPAGIVVINGHDFGSQVKNILDS
jgi:phage tail tube protein FII